ncbi:MAG: maleylacetoacetate isomerase [Novosphingobium sp.]
MDKDRDHGAGEALVLHGYWRSTASWRVRIALGLKHVNWQTQSHDLRTGEQGQADYLALNPQGFVPTLEVGGTPLTQSLAIIEWLEETYPDPPLLPGNAFLRARIRAFAQVIACDIHPVQNLKVLKMLKARGLDQAAIDAWAAEVIEAGLAACAELIANVEGPFCFGDRVTLADVLLVPQLGNARRFGARFDFGRILQIEQACNALPAFAAARPEAQVA